MAKKSDKTQNQTKKAKTLEIQDPLGKRRPLLGAFLLFVSILLILASIDYAVAQDIFFADSFFNFLTSTTEVDSRNICGKVGATITSMGLWLFGVAYFMIVAFVFYTSLFCFRRSPRLLPLTLKIAMPLAVISMAMSAAILQRALNMEANFESFSSAYFRNGWGGIIALHSFEDLLFSLINVTGSLILFLGIYFVCLVLIFVENPKNLCEDLSVYAKKSPSFMGRILGKFFGVLFIPFKKKPKVVELESDDILLSPSGKEEIKIKTSRKKKAKAEEVLSSPTQEDTEDVKEEKEEGISAPQEEAQEIQEQEPQVKISPLSFGNDEDKELSPEEIASLKKIDEPIKSISGSKPSKDSSLKIERYEQEKVKAPQIPQKKGDYIFPPLSLLKAAPPEKEEDTEDYQSMMDNIIAAFDSFKIKVEQAGVYQGPVITRYELRPAKGVRVSKIASLEKDLALALEAFKVRIIAPVPGKGTIGVEVPNKKRSAVYMRDILESPQWLESKAEIPIVLGKDVEGRAIVEDLAKMPHALVAGSTGSGKSVCVNAIIASLCYKYTPEELRFIMIDPKIVEFKAYNTLPHMLVPVVTDAQKAPSALKWLLTEMTERYKVLSACNVKNVASFNAKIAKEELEAKKAKALEALMSFEERQALEEARQEIEEEIEADVLIPKKKYPFIVCIIDELAALMAIAKKEVEVTIVRLTQEARAAGIHLILATQRPSTDIITGVIKANLPVRIAFKVTSLVDSRTILDTKGAETLIGKGDMLFVPPGSSDLIRAQGAFMTEDETNDIVEFLKCNGEPEYVEEVQSQIDAGVDGEAEGDGKDYGDVMVNKAIEIIRINQKASVSLLQRKLSIGYGRASRIIDILEDEGMIGADQGPNKQRDIYL